jgi:hypothetical protein
MPQKQSAMMDSLATPTAQDIPAIFKNPIIMDLLKNLSSGINTGKNAVQGVLDYPMKAAQNAGLSADPLSIAGDAMRKLSQSSAQDERSAEWAEIIRKILEGQVDERVLTDKLQMAPGDTTNGTQ